MRLLSFFHRHHYCNKFLGILIAIILRYIQWVHCRVFLCFAVKLHWIVTSLLRKFRSEKIIELGEDCAIAMISESFSRQIVSNYFIIFVVSFIAPFRRFLSLNKISSIGNQTINAQLSHCDVHAYSWDTPSCTAFRRPFHNY